MKIKMNVGGLDRTLRIAGGSALVLAWAFLMKGSSVVLGIGLAMVAIGLVGFCPLYVPFGITTRREGSAPPRRGADGRL